jgi:hypothetical protein
MPTIIDDPTTLNALVHVHVFGGSVEPTTDYEISQAVESGRCDNLVCTPTVLQYDYGWNGTHDVINVLNDNFGHRLFDLRHGKAYQADIEAHVAAYRGHIPDYVGSGDWLAKGIAKVTKRSIVDFDERLVGTKYDGYVVTIGRDVDQDGMTSYDEQVAHSDLAIAFWNAAIRACGYVEGGE